MTPELISVLIIAFASFVIIILERIYPYRKNQKFLRKGFFNDFFLYTILQNYVLGLIIFSFLGFVYEHTRINSLRLLAGIPVYIQVFVFIITHDFYIYWFHRWQHNNAALWRIHEAHHSSEEVDWLSGSKSHALEILINQTVEFAPLIFLGASPVTALAKGVISAVWGMFIHSNIDVRMGYLQYFINGPEMHRWHHSDDDGEEYKSNYSTKLAIWDFIFGTDFFPDSKKRKPVMYGLKDTPDYPSNYFRQFLFAFRKSK